ncbi:MAG TPA: pyruvate kinase [Candidatus Acidoferrales bacterium]|nr:pyruvate kinase [Candidatus Acidoferrales bacterium]
MRIELLLKTKVLVTYGPAISGKGALREVLRHADIVRINFSHMNEEYWLGAMKAVQSCAASLGKEVALLADLPGPKIRIAKLDAPIEVRKGQTVRFSPEPRKGCIEVMYKPLARESRNGMIIDIGDGNARFKVTEVNGKEVICRALENGVISSRKGVSITGATLNLEVPTKRDLELARFASSHGFDFVAVSYVRSAEEIVKVREVAGSLGVIAKIETTDAIRNLSGIVKYADGIMVARGDLSMQVKLEHLPEAQRRIISTTRLQGKPVIVATQLLTSMLQNPTPTRAEANDIANAVMQGADCLMLSDETIIGKYPVAAVRFLVKSAAVAERFTVHDNHIHPKISSVSMAIAFAAADLADQYKTDCIFVPTRTGTTAKSISALRPHTQIIALASEERVGRSLSLYYGIRTRAIRYQQSMDKMLASVHVIAKKEAIRNYLVVSGSPNRPGATTLKYVEAEMPRRPKSKSGESEI